MIEQAVKSAAKRTLVGLCKGVEWRPRRGRDAIVTLLHDVGGTPSDYNIVESVFRAQLDYLCERDVTWYRASELARNLASLDGGNGVCITFDDGTLSGYDAALELLAAGARCTHFIIAERVNRGHENTMSWAQIRELDAAGVEIGSHSLTHPHLPGVSDAELEAELGTSKSIIEDELGKAVTSFAYPYGEFSQRVVDAVAESGYDCAFTTRHLYASQQSDVFRIPRFEPLESLQSLADIFEGRGHRFYRWLSAYYDLRDRARS